MIDLSGRLEPRSVPRVSTLRRLFPLALVLLDVYLIFVAFIIAYWMRYQLKVGPTITEQLSFAQYRPIGALLIGLLVPVLAIKGAYRTRMSREVVHEAATVFSASTITIAAIVVITAMLHKWLYSRGVIIYLWVLVPAILVSGRTVFRWIQGVFYRQGWGTRRLIVVGATNAGRMVMQQVISRNDLGYELAGFVGQRNAVSLRDFGRFRALGTVADLPELLEAGDVDEIIIALPASEHEEVVTILSLCERRGVGLKLVPDLFEMSLSRVEMDNIAGIPLLDIRDKPLRHVSRAFKRSVDMVVSLALLVVSFPLLLILGALIRMESKGSPLLWQERIGLAGRQFKCLKLRTMRPDAEALQSDLQTMNETTGPHFKMRDDPRCTPLGRRVRRWSIDELPQLWNVLRGEMSLVGPRPPLPTEVARYEPEHMRRLDVKPGMTGVWQVSGRSHLSFDEMVTMDIYYVENWSPLLDLRILTRTVAAVLARHGAY